MSDSLSSDSGGNTATSEDDSSSGDDDSLQYTEFSWEPGELFNNEAATVLEGIIDGLFEVEKQLDHTTLRDVLRAVCPDETPDIEVAMKCLACLLWSPGNNDCSEVTATDYPLLKGINVTDEIAKILDKSWLHLIRYYACVENTFMTRAIGVEADAISRDTIVPLNVVESIFDRDIVKCYKATHNPLPTDKGTPWWLPEFAALSMDVNLTDDERGRINHYVAERTGVEIRHALFLLGDVLNRQVVAKHSINDRMDECGSVFLLLFYMAHNGMLGSDNVFLKRPDLITSDFPVPYPFGVVLTKEDTPLNKSYNGPVDGAIRFRMRYDTEGLQRFTINNMPANVNIECSDEDAFTMTFDDLIIVTNNHFTFMNMFVSEFAFATLDMTAPNATLTSDCGLSTYIDIYTSNNGDDHVMPPAHNIFMQRREHNVLENNRPFIDADFLINALFCPFQFVIQWQCEMIPLAFMYGKQLWLRDPVANFVLIYAMTLDHHKVTGRYDPFITKDCISITTSSFINQYDYNDTELIIPLQHVVYIARHYTTGGDSARSADMLKETLTGFINHNNQPIANVYTGTTPWLDTTKFFDTKPHQSAQFDALHRVWDKHRDEVVDMESARHVFETHIMVTE